MTYTMNRTIEKPDFEAVDKRFREALAEHGFGALTDIDVKATMKKKLDGDMAPIACSAPAIQRWPSRRSAWSLAQDQSCHEKR